MADQVRPLRRPVVVFATRVGPLVTVFRQTGEAPPVAAFDYDDGLTDLPASPEPVPPQVALAPDGRRVAYVARSGLRTRDLLTGEDRVVVGRGERPAEEEGFPPPWWSVPEMNGRDDDPHHLTGVFSIRTPAWSPDGRYLAFAQGAYEFQGHGMVELATGRYFSDPGSSWLAWSPRSDRVVVAGTWFAGRGELAISRPGDLGAYEDLRPIIGAPATASFEEAVIDGSARTVAVAFADDEVRTPTHIRLVDLPTGRAVEVPGEGEKSALAFTAEDRSLLFVERRPAGAVVVRYELATGIVSDLGPLPEELSHAVLAGFTPDGETVLVARLPLPGEEGVDACDRNCPEYRARAVVVAPAGGVRLVGPVLDRFSALAGLAMEAPLG